MLTVKRGSHLTACTEEPAIFFAVLIRHGLGDLVRRTGLATALERAGQILHWSEAGKRRMAPPLLLTSWNWLNWIN